MVPDLESDLDRGLDLESDLDRGPDLESDLDRGPDLESDLGSGFWILLVVSHAVQCSAVHPCRAMHAACCPALLVSVFLWMRMIRCDLSL